MSKLLRSELKSIVKECLVEILAEGIGSNNSVHEVKAKKQKNIKQKVPMKKRRSHLDSIQYKSKNSKIQNTSLTNDPVLNELLADTAKTTLQEQLAADSKRRMSEASRPADSAALKVSNSQPEELFGGEAASKWAKLAFFDQ